MKRTVIAPEGETHLLSAVELAEFLSVPLSTIYYWRHVGKVPQLCEPVDCSALILHPCVHGLRGGPVDGEHHETVTQVGLVGAISRSIRACKEQFVSEAS